LGDIGKLPPGRRAPARGGPVHRRDPGVEAIAFATSVAVHDPPLVPNLSRNISCVAAAWALIDDHGPPDRTRRSHGAGRQSRDQCG